MLDYIETNLVDEPKSCVIWLHGLGAGSDDFAPLVPMLNMPESLAVRFIFPQAPSIPVTLNNGFIMPAWYDIYGLDHNSKQDETGIQASTNALVEIIKQQNETGIPSDKIVLIGFSQGGAIALHAGLHYPEKLAGIAGLSTYLPLHEDFGTKNEKANQHTPIFIAHGTSDQVVPLSYGERSKDLLITHEYAVTWKTYPMAHTVDPEEIADISRFLQDCLA